MADTVYKIHPEVFHPGANRRQLTAGDDIALVIHDADGPVYGVLHLNDYILKNSARHDAFSILPVSG